MKLEHDATLTVELKKAKDKHSIEIAKVRQELSDLKTLTIPYLSRSQSNMNKAAGLGRRGSLLSSVGGGSRRGSMMSVAKSRRASIIGTMSVREEDSQTGRFRRQRRESEIIEEHAISGDVKLYSETGKAKDEAGLPNRKLSLRKLKELAAFPSNIQAGKGYDDNAAAAAAAAAEHAANHKDDNSVSTLESNSSAEGSLSPSQSQYTPSSSVSTSRRNKEEIEFRTSLVLNALDMLSSHTTALIEEFGARSCGSGADGETPFSLLQGAIHWITKAVENSSKDFMREIGLDEFWSGEVDGRLWLRGSVGLCDGEDTIKADDVISVQPSLSLFRSAEEMGRSLCGSFTQHLSTGGMKLYEDLLSESDFDRGVDLRGCPDSIISAASFGPAARAFPSLNTPRGASGTPRVRGFSDSGRGGDTATPMGKSSAGGGTERNASSSGGAFFNLDKDGAAATTPTASRSSSRRIMMILIPVYVSGNVVGFMRIVKAATKKMIFSEEQEKEDLWEEGGMAARFSAIELSLYQSMGLLVCKTLAMILKANRQSELLEVQGKVAAERSYGDGIQVGKEEMRVAMVSKVEDNERALER